MQPGRQELLAPAQLPVGGSTVPTLPLHQTLAGQDTKRERREGRASTHLPPAACGLLPEGPVPLVRHPMRAGLGPGAGAPQSSADCAPTAAPACLGPGGQCRPSQQPFPTLPALRKATEQTPTACVFVAVIKCLFGQRAKKWAGTPSVKDPRLQVTVTIHRIAPCTVYTKPKWPAEPRASPCRGLASLMGPCSLSLSPPQSCPWLRSGPRMQAGRQGQALAGLQAFYSLRTF